MLWGPPASETAGDLLKMQILKPQTILGNLCAYHAFKLDIPRPLHGDGVSVPSDGNLLGLGSGDGCTALSIFKPPKTV